jgi:hypothetical protein
MLHFEREARPWRDWRTWPLLLYQDIDRSANSVEDSEDRGGSVSSGLQRHVQRISKTGGE